MLHIGRGYVHRRSVAYKEKIGVHTLYTIMCAGATRAEGLQSVSDEIVLFSFT